jgi:hypothetical protein
MSSAKFLITETASLIEPLAVSIPQTAQITGESRSQVYVRIARGEYEAVKSGARTLIIYDSIKRRVASLPRAKIKLPAPRRHPRARRDSK